MRQFRNREPWRIVRSPSPPRDAGAYTSRPEPVAWNANAPPFVGRNVASIPEKGIADRVPPVPRVPMPKSSNAPVHAETWTYMEGEGTSTVRFASASTWRSPTATATVDRRLQFQSEGLEPLNRDRLESATRPSRPRISAR